jgi:hypothetical protein
MNVLIDHIHGAVVLENLKRRSQIRGSRHSGLETPSLGVCRLSICEVLPP